MTSISNSWKLLTSILSNLNNFYSLEVVDSVSETQLQVLENSDWIIWRLKGWRIKLIKMENIAPVKINNLRKLGHFSSKCLKIWTHSVLVLTMILPSTTWSWTQAIIIIINVWCTVEHGMSSHSYEQPTSYGRPLGHSPKWHFLYK